MQKPNELSTATEPFDSSAGTLDVPAKEAPGSEPPPAPSSAAAATKTTPVQIVLIVLGVDCLPLLRPSRGLAGLPGLCGGNGPETAHPLVVLLPHSAGALRRGRALPPGGRRRDWFLPIGPPGVDVDERSAATHDRVEATGSENVPAHRALQPGGGGGEQPGRDGGGKEEQKKAPTVELKDSRGTSAIHQLDRNSPRRAWARRWCCSTCCSPRATCSCRSWST